MNLNNHVAEKALTLVVSGDLVSTTVQAAQRDFDVLTQGADWVADGWAIFRLDLAQAKMVDSVGLNLVVTFLRQAQKRGVKMQVAYSSRNVLRTFIFTRLDKHLQLVQV